ncbi:MAG TPA: 2-oxo-4-hydroxy-4-carboxy-5-ureidoimidazoline decarboxylase [Pyrinomonadaceae bacterium]|nr:2-oxo-4-hydroxy-4-carboxy-5-ureidoimidazoline decarboxylase [Pyrinomonadaceae bacterium]
MTRDLAWLNSLTAGEAAKELLQCCGSKRWATEMAKRRPYATLETLIAAANDVWWSLDKDDWLEAFRSHPKIGEKKASDKVSAQSQQWSGQEQAGVADASNVTASSLAELNHTYEQKFGFIFIICATGKTSDEMLTALRERLQHEPEAELPIAAAEQSKITELRLKKLLEPQKGTKST